MANEFIVKNGIKIPTETASTVPYLDANKKLVSSDVTPTELDYLDGVSSNIQTQLDSKASSSSVTDHLNDTTDAHDASAISSVAAGNLAATTVQAALDELQTDIDTRATSNSPTLTTPSIDIITLDGQASTPANPSAGNYKVYVKDATQKLTVLDSTGAETTVGTGSGGGATTNYIASPDGTAIGDWATYADAAATTPVDGTGGSPSSTYAVSTDPSLRGASNFLWTHSAANRQGEGFSYNFTINPADKGKVLQCSFEYLVASGTYADDDLQFWIYDVTNATLIQPAPYKLKKSGIIEKFAFEFQTASNSTSYRLIGHVATSTATAYTIRFDNWNLGPQAKLYGSPMTDWVSYTPTTTNVGTATFSALTGRWRRVGDSAEIVIAAVASGAGSGASAFTFSFPSGLVGDTGKYASGLTTGTANHYSLEAASQYDTSGAGLVSTSTIGVVNNGTGGNFTGADIRADTQIYIRALIPIVGWSSSTVMSHDASTRVVSLSALRSGTPGAQTITAGAASEIIFDYINPNGDTHGGYSTTTGRYTAKVPGWYRYSSVLMINTGGTAPTYYNVYGQKNGTGSTFGLVYNSDTIANKSYGVSLSGKVFLNAGDYLSLWAYSVGQNITIATGQNTNTFELERISGPSQIAASEVVAGDWYKNGNTTYNSNAARQQILIDTANLDTHSMLSSNTVVIQTPGIYEIDAQAYFSGANIVSGGLYSVLVTKTTLGGTVLAGAESRASAAGAVTSCTATGIRSLVTGDILYFAVSTNQNHSASTITVDGSTTFLTKISVRRLGGI